MKGQISIEKMHNGKTVCVLTVPQKEDVNALTLELMSAGFDVLYEPKSTDTGYKSCVIIGEVSYIRIVAEKEYRKNKRCGRNIVAK